MTYNTDYFIINGGKVVAGDCSGRPIVHRIRINIHGTYRSASLPIVGNKVMACINCKMIMHGETKDPKYIKLT